MQLNHLNLSVDNLAEAREFFQQHFDFQVIDQKGAALAVLTDRHGFTLVLSDRQAFGDAGPTHYPDGFHIGFIVETADQVDQVYNRLATAGISLGHAPKSARGSYVFYFTALNSLLIEVSCPA